MSSYSAIRVRINALFFLFKKSLSGESQDYTTGSIRRAVFLLSVPMILEMCMESVFAVVDIFYVGRISTQAVAAVGLTESVLTLVYAVAVGLSMAATAMVARRIGEKKPGDAARAAVQSLIIALFFAATVSVAGVMLAPGILKIMGASAEVAAFGASFTRIIFGGSTVIMLLFLINGIFRGAGNASIAMWSLWIANGINIVLCPIMIHFYGLKGAAIATTIGRGTGVCFQLYHLFGGKGAIRVMRKYFIPDWTIIKSIFNIAWTGTFQFLIGSASWIAMVRLISHFGSNSVAGYQVAIRIILFFLLPAWGMSNAAATLVGQNLGAQQPARAESSVWATAKYNAIFLGSVSLIFLIGSGPIVRFMNSDLAVQDIATQALHIVSLGYIFYGVGMVLVNAFNGAGDTKTPTVINLFCFWLFQIPVAYLLSIVLDLGAKGVFLAIVITETLVAFVAYFLFKKGSWKKVKV